MSRSTEFLPETKKCRKCGKIKNKDKFHLSSSRTLDGLNSYCKECGKLNRRKNHLQHKYDITEVQYELMLKSQNGVCAICNKPETIIKQNNKIQKLLVDHDHKTGKVRGLLCNKCNIFLAHVENNPEILKTITKYLKEK